MPRVIDGKTGRVTDYNVTPRRTPGGLSGTAKDAASYVARNVSEITTPGGLGIVQGEPIPDGYGGYKFPGADGSSGAYGGYDPLPANKEIVGRNLITGDIYYTDGSVYHANGEMVHPPGTPVPVSIFDSLAESLGDPAGGANKLLEMVKLYGPPLLLGYAALKVLELSRSRR